MPNVLVGKHRTGHVAHDLMHFNQNLQSILGMKVNRLNVRVNLTPLLGPVRANFVRSTGKTAFERFRPSNVNSHKGERSTNVTRVEGRVRCA